MELSDIDNGILEIGAPTDIIGVRVIESGKPGPAIGLMGMLHGNEPAGLGLWDLMIQAGPPSVGTVYMIVGHPEALCNKHGPVRSIEQDINRLFGEKKGNRKAISIDHARCIELEEFLPKLDLLIDIHSTSAQTQPFIVMPKKPLKYIKLAGGLPITHLFGLDQFLNRTAANWLAHHGKAAIMIEVGQHEHPVSRAVATDVARRILDGLNMLREGTSIEMKSFSFQQRFVAILDQVRVENTGFEFVKNRSNFESVHAGELIAKDSIRTYRAPPLNNMLICLPTAIEVLRERIVTEAYYIGLDLEFMRHALSAGSNTIDCEP